MSLRIMIDTLVQNDCAFVSDSLPQLSEKVKVPL